MTSFSVYTVISPYIQNEIPDTICANSPMFNLLYTISSIIVLLHHLMFALIRSSLNLADISPLFSLEMSRDNAATCVTAKEVLGDDVLDTHDMTTVSEPMEEGISENIDESNERHNV